MSSEATSNIPLSSRAFNLEPVDKRADVGVVCVHGFTGTPSDMRPLGEALVQAGIAAHCPLLPGHGDKPSALKGLSWHDWADAIHMAFVRMQRTYAHVFVTGLSMGGLITLHLAASMTAGQASLGGICVLAAPAAINDPRVKLVRFARYVVPWHYPLGLADFNNPAVREELSRRVGSDVNLDDKRAQRAIVKGARIPLGAIHELMVLNATVMRELPRVTVPALFVQGRKDRVVALDSADVLAAGSGSREKQVVWLPNSGHVLPHQPDAPLLFERILAFIRAHTPT